MIGYSGFDFVFLDTEHALIESDRQLAHLIRAAETSGLTPIVRVKENREHFIRNALEAGAQGVVVPHIATKEDAQKAVSYARFPPKGIRGADPGVRSARYRCGQFNWAEFIEYSNRESMVIPLFEDRPFLDHLEEILAVEGIDAVSFGPTDYALSLGLNLLYDFNHEKINSAFQAIIAGAKKRNLPVLALVNPATAAQAQKLIDQGVKFLLLGTDTALISAGLKNLWEETAAKVK
jgi:4-hydroxy-2-oxoheptanedioate aldolase